MEGLALIPPGTHSSTCYKRSLHGCEPLTHVKHALFASIIGCLCAAGRYSSHHRGSCSSGLWCQGDRGYFSINLLEQLSHELPHYYYVSLFTHELVWNSDFRLWRSRVFSYHFKPPLILFLLSLSSHLGDVFAFSLQRVQAALK